MSEPNALWGSAEDIDKILDEFGERRRKRVQEVIELLARGRKLKQELRNCDDLLRNDTPNRDLYEGKKPLVAEEGKASSAKRDEINPLPAFICKPANANQVPSQQADAEHPRPKVEEERDINVDDNKMLLSTARVNPVAGKHTLLAQIIAQLHNPSLETMNRRLLSHDLEGTPKQIPSQPEHAEETAPKGISSLEEVLRLTLQEIESATLKISTLEQQLGEARDALRSAYQRLQAIGAVFLIRSEGLESKRRKIGLSEREGGQAETSG